MLYRGWNRKKITLKFLNYVLAWKKGNLLLDKTSTEELYINNITGDRFEQHTNITILEVIGDQKFYKYMIN